MGERRYRDNELICIAAIKKLKTLVFTFKISVISSCSDFCALLSFCPVFFVVVSLIWGLGGQTIREV